MDDNPTQDPAQRLVVHARFVAVPGRGESLLDAVGAMLEAARGETGTLVYAVHRDRDDPDAVVMYEVYETDAALDAHGASDAAARFGAQLDDLLAEEPVAWFTRPLAAKGIDGVLAVPGEAGSSPRT